MVFEKLKRWPKSMRNIDLIRLLKEGGGHRLIGLLPSLYRLWGKIRRPLCQEWEHENKDAGDFAAEGQSAQRAAWDFALVNEACLGSGGHTIAWQGDLEKCYELFPFGLILREAETLGFPCTLARLAINMYAGARRIVVDKAYSKAVGTTKGIVAGCPMATTIVKVCMRRLMRKLDEAFPSITRRIFLDDLSLQWKGRRLEKVGARGGGKGWEAPKVFMEAVKFCAEGLESTLKAKVSKKSRYLASSKSLLEACINEGKRMGLGEKGEGADITRYMGVDYSAVTSVSGMKPTRKKRWVKAKEKVKRVRQLRKPGCEVGHIWASGPGASIGFGAEVY